MKLFEVMMSREAILRSTVGQMVSAKGMVHVLHKLFGSEFKLQDVAPYVRAFNQAAKSATNAEEADQVWNKLNSELSHARKRQLPDE